MLSISGEALLRSSSARHPSSRRACSLALTVAKAGWTSRPEPAQPRSDMQAPPVIEAPAIGGMDMDEAAPLGAHTFSSSLRLPACERLRPRALRRVR